MSFANPYKGSNNRCGLFRYGPFRGVGRGGGTEAAIVEILEGLFGHKNTLQVRGVELQLDILSLRRRRDEEVIMTLYIALRTRHAAAIAADKGRKDTFGFREGHSDNRRHRRGHVVLYRESPIGIRRITRVDERIGILAAGEKDR